MTSRNVRRWVGLTALIALAGTVLIGCAVKEAPAPSPPPSSAEAPAAKLRQPSEEPEKPKEEPKTIYQVGDTVDLQRIAVQDLDGQDLDWDQYRGKILVLNYFATG